MTNNCTGPQRLSAYYAGAGLIPYGTVGFPYGVRTNIPTNGPIAISNFYGASFDAGQFINGDFEIVINVTEDSLKYNMVGWTIYKQATRLNNNAQIANCFTPNQINTPTPLPPLGTTSPGDNVTFSTDISPNPTFRMRLLDTSDPLYAPLAVPGSSGKYIMELRNSATFAGPVSITNPNAYGILRGPYLVCDNTVELAVGDTVSFKWRANKDPQGDRFSVYIYLLRTTDCAKITLLDSTGDSTTWQTVDTVIQSGQAGQYRFIAIHGSYDSVGGIKVGAYLYLDEIKLTKAAVVPGQTTTTTSTTTSSFVYDGNTELYISPGTLIEKKSLSAGGGITWRYTASVLQSTGNVAQKFTVGLRKGEPTIHSGGVLNTFAVDSTILSPTGIGNVWLPGPVFTAAYGVSPTVGSTQNFVNGNGEFGRPYSDVTLTYFEIPGSKTGYPDLYRMYVEGGGGASFKYLEVTPTTPISLDSLTMPLITSAPAIWNLMKSYDEERYLEESQQATFTVTDSRGGNTRLPYFVYPVSGWDGLIPSEYFVGATGGPYISQLTPIITGNVDIVNGTGQITLQTIANVQVQGNRTFSIEIRDASQKIVVIKRSFMLIDKIPQGQIEFTTVGITTWQVPSGVTQISIFAVGGGAGGTTDTVGQGLLGGAGGNTAYRTISVVPGSTYTVVVGAGGTGGNSTVAAGFGGVSFVSTNSDPNNAVCLAWGGGSGSAMFTNQQFEIGESGKGGNGVGLGSGGGAGGYAGSGGNAHSSSGVSGNNGGGGGGAGGNYNTGQNGGSGGGVGIRGRGANGQGGSSNAGEPANGSAGSGGTGILYGGGGAGLAPPATTGQAGGQGAVRIIWGRGRGYPSSGTDNMPTISV